MNNKDTVTSLRERGSWAALRTREEIAQDEKEDQARRDHEDGVCERDYCFWCIEEREQELEEEGGNKRGASGRGHQEGR